MSEQAENFLKSWKGAQAIIELHPIPRYVILTLMGLGGVVLSTLIFSGYLLPILFGGFFGGLFVLLSILSIEVSISRDRKKSHLKRQIEIRQIIIDMFPYIGKEILEEFMQRITNSLDSIPDEQNTFEPFNEVWKERIRHLEEDYQNQQAINKNNIMERKNFKDNYERIYRYIARLNQEVFRLKWKLMKLERHKKEDEL